jgi:hypothetical protein
MLAPPHTRSFCTAGLWPTPLTFMCRTYGAQHLHAMSAQGFRPGLTYAAPTALPPPQCRTSALPSYAVSIRTIRPTAPTQQISAPVQDFSYRRWIRFLRSRASTAIHQRRRRGTRLAQPGRAGYGCPNYRKRRRCDTFNARSRCAANRKATQSRALAGIRK